MQAVFVMLAVRTLGKKLKNIKQVRPTYLAPKTSANLEKAQQDPVDPHHPPHTALVAPRGVEAGHASSIISA